MQEARRRSGRWKCLRWMEEEQGAGDRENEYSPLLPLILHSLLFLAAYIYSLCLVMLDTTREGLVDVRLGQESRELLMPVLKHLCRNSALFYLFTYFLIVTCVFKGVYLFILFFFYGSSGKLELPARFNISSFLWLEPFQEGGFKTLVPQFSTILLASLLGLAPQGFFFFFSCLFPLNSDPLT